MALTEQKRLGDKDVTVRELTVTEIRDWMAAVESASEESRPSLDLGDVLFEDVGFKELAMMTDARPEDLEGATPSELRELADLCKRVNSHFFAMNERLNAGLRALVERQLKS